MQVNHIELFQARLQCSAHVERAVKSSSNVGRIVPDTDTITVDGIAKRNLGVVGAVDVRGVHVHFMPAIDSSGCKGMNRLNGAPIADGGVIARNNMQDSHSSQPSHLIPRPHPYFSARRN